MNLIYHFQMAQILIKMFNKLMTQPNTPLPCCCSAVVLDNDDNGRCSGNGLGVAGTRDPVLDLPMLWATPSPSGFLMTSPSVRRQL